MAVNIVSLDKGIIPEGILDLDRGSLEERSLALGIVAVRHSSASTVAANSR